MSSGWMPPCSAERGDDSAGVKLGDGGACIGRERSEAHGDSVWGKRERERTNQMRCDGWESELPREIYILQMEFAMVNMNLPS